MDSRLALLQAENVLNTFVIQSLSARYLGISKVCRRLNLFGGFADKITTNIQSIVLEATVSVRPHH